MPFEALAQEGRSQCERLRTFIASSQTIANEDCRAEASWTRTDDATIALVLGDFRRGLSRWLDEPGDATEVFWPQHGPAELHKPAFDQATVLHDTDGG